VQYTRLGSSGLTVSRICLGGNSWGAKGHRQWSPFDAAASRPFLRRALDLGINFFDTADVYNTGASEEVMGQELIGLVPRDELVITTKVGGTMSSKPNGAGLGRKHVLASIDASLKRLRTDHVDIYMLHRFDMATPVEETLGALAEIVRAGKARYIGASTMRATQFARLQLGAKAIGMPFVAMQNLYNLIDREEEADMNPFCAEEGVAITPYSPLARGILSGSRAVGGGTERAGMDRIADRYQPAQTGPVVERVQRVAQETGFPASQVALAWLLHQTAVAAPVVGVTKPEQIDGAAAATGLTLTAEQLATLVGSNPAG